jgi:hypothetical protein
VGHRIIEINAQSVVAVPHERIVNLLATSVGEVSAPPYLLPRLWSLAGGHENCNTMTLAKP